MAPPPPDLTAFATQSVTVSDSGGSENDLSFASLDGLRADVGAVLEPPRGTVAELTGKSLARTGSI